MKIGILGSGSVGQTLGKGLAARGHAVCIGTRSPEALTTWCTDVGALGSAAPFAICVAWAELVVLSVRGGAVEAVLRSVEPRHFANKVVIDTSDPLDFSSGRPSLFVGTTDSLGERVQRWLPNARVVKALNTVLAAVMIEPSLSGGEPDMFIAGNDHAAKRQVTELLEAFGWPVIDLGDIENARWLEALSLLWVVYSHRTGKQHHAFKLVGK